MNESVIEANLSRELWLKEPGGFLVYHIPLDWISRFGVSGPTRDRRSEEMFCYEPVTTTPNSSVSSAFVSIALLQRMEEITREEAAEIHPQCVETVDAEISLWTRVDPDAPALPPVEPTQWGYAVHAYAIVRVKVMVPVEGADCPNAAVRLVDDYLSSRLPQLFNNDAPPFDGHGLDVQTIEYAEDIESFLVDTLNDDGDPIQETRFNKYGQLLTGREDPAVPDRSRKPPVDPTPTPREDRTRSIVLDQLNEEIP